VADWPWQRKKEKEKSGPERAASYCLHERAKEPGGWIISHHRGNRARARPMASPSARATLCAHPHAKAQGYGGAATATPKWNGMGIIRGRSPGKALFSCHVNPKYFLFYPLYRIFKHMHGTLNVDKKTNCIVCL
jgi:hypothetical protein